MQSTGLNALAALVAAPPATTTDSAASGDEGAPGQFSQLLSDSGKQYDNNSSAPNPSMGAKMLQSATAGALSAQEVLSPAEQIAQLLAQREQMVSPDDAKELMKHVAAMTAQSTGTNETQALAQIKDQLQTILTTGTPKSIADILAAAPAVKEAKFSLVGLTALLTAKKNTAGSQNDPAAKEETAATVTPVPPVVFRPDAGAVAANATAAKSDAKKESLKKDDADDAASDTVTVIVPLAMPVTQPVVVASPVASAASGADINVSDIMPPAALKPRSDLDQVIPPLTRNDGDDTLPEVNLPKAGTIAEANAEKSAASDFQSLATAAGMESAKATDDKQVSAKQADLSALTNVAPAGSAGTTQTASAVQPVAVVATPGLVNHAAVSDQVSVAVTKATKDGIDHITIQLDPAGLGRVEVNLHTSRDGQTQISFTVDKADTFDNLSRDARSLERSLQEAGIKADTGSMQFNMRQQPQPQMHSDLGNGQGQRPQQQASAQDNSAAETTTSVASIAIPTTTRNYLFNVREGVDISA